VNRFERRLVATSTFLNQVGRLELTNSVFSAFPTFCMGTFSIHNTVINQIDKFRNHCLWRGADINAQQRPKAAWVGVCRSKEEGGLGILNLKTPNEALLLKQMAKFFNREDIPWVVVGKQGFLAGEMRVGPLPKRVPWVEVVGRYIRWDQAKLEFHK
jgi:hypothetical protein